MTLHPAERLCQLVLAACDRFPERLAVRDDRGASLTYAALAAAARSTAGALDAAGHRAGQPVLVAVDNAARDLAHQVGVWLAGGTAVPVHRSVGSVVLVERAARVGAALLVSDEDSVPVGWRDAVTPVAGGAVHRGTWPARRVPAELDRDQALVIFTSGSTGQPKGVVIGHRAFTAKLRAIQSVLPFATGEVLAQVLHLHFSFGQWTSLLTLATGGELRLVHRFAVPTVLDLLSSGPVARIPVVPTMLRLLLREVDGGRVDPATRAALSRVASPGVWICGGEPLSAGLGRRIRTLFPHAGVADVFGLSESATSDFVVRPADYDDVAGTLGRHPSPGVRARVARGDGTACATDEVGELELHTPYLMTGYVDDPPATAAALRDGWLRTGDLARVRADGAFVLMGRSKNLIVRGGTKVSPLEIEDVYTGHPGCAGAVAIGLPDDVLGERIHLLYVAAGPAPAPADLRAWGRARLEPYKVPDHVHLVADLPLGATGKVDRMAAGRLARQRLAAG